MVCRRCILSVEQLLEKHGIPFSDIALGTVTLPEMPDLDKQDEHQRSPGTVRFDPALQAVDRDAGEIDV